MTAGPDTVEHRRLAEDGRREKNWKRWGPYLAERQWGTVREDYSPRGDSWTYFPHDHAHLRTYRWGEDGLLGFTDRQCRLCFAIALWNEKDPILKERLFGLTGPEGNHGEDVKELYYYLDSTPTHSYCRGLYKYPQARFPYDRLRRENRRRGYGDREFEIVDTGVFDENRYFDVTFEYAKGAPNDILIQVTAVNRGPDEAPLHVLPTLWYRNTWIWGCRHEGCTPKPRIQMAGDDVLWCDHVTLGRFLLQVERVEKHAAPRFLFTENESNAPRLWGAKTYTRHLKDAFHEFVVGGRTDAVNPRRVGTKSALHHVCRLGPGESVTLRLRLSRDGDQPAVPFGADFAAILDQRRAEADEFYEALYPQGLGEPERQIYRQSCAGLLWTKQFYHYSVEDWLRGDPDVMEPPPSRWQGRNNGWLHLFNRDVISMPDKWEYPWYAAWDLAFHMVPFAHLDPAFAKDQLILLLREWYMHPNGMLPAYEFAFGDVNPPVHAAACLGVYRKGGPPGRRDVEFLARAFHKLLINFTWWVNRKDPEGKNIFSGGFLGMDNVGVFDRSRPLPTGGHLEQADGTAWMAFYCSTMLTIALELATHDRTYEDVASKFFEHFVSIADAMNTFGGSGLWDEEDGFYYDRILLDGRSIPLRVRSMVGLVPLFAVGILDDEVLERLPGFSKRMQWYISHRPDLARHISYLECDGCRSGRHLLAIPSRERLLRLLAYLLDEREFLSPHGIRSLSLHHRDHPYVFHHDGTEHRVEYVPGESDSGLFGGNSNWRGPVWFPVNFLIKEALEVYYQHYGDSLRVECPVGSGRMLTLRGVGLEIARRLCRIFLPDEQGQRPCHGEDRRYAQDPHFRDLLLFYEYFHPETGRGAGASHQTGWTALVASLLEDIVED